MPLVLTTLGLVLGAPALLLALAGAVLAWRTERGTASARSVLVRAPRAERPAAAPARAAATASGSDRP